MNDSDAKLHREPPWGLKTAAALDAEAFSDPGWLIDQVWPGDAYGVLAAPAKAGKSWLAIDLLVSATTGTPFLGHFDTGRAGPVLMYCGEGVERNLQRRLRAVCAERGVPMPENLYYTCFAPNLTSAHHLEQISSDLAATRPRLVVLDPLYLSMGGMNMASLTEVGPVLKAIQALCEEFGAALVIVHHFNQTGHGLSARRISGAGPEEWGRVLMTVTVKESHDDETGATVASLTIDVKGSEVSAQSFTVERRVWTDGDELTAPMHYETAWTSDGQANGADGHAARVLRVLQARAGESLSRKEIQRAIAEDGIKLGDRSVQLALKQLADVGFIERGGPGGRGGLHYTFIEKNAKAA